MSQTSGYSKLKFLGGTKEVGRSGVALSSDGTNVLLDYGILLNRQPDFPVHISPKNIDGIILSHAHLDHSGGIPLFYLREKIPLYTTPLTLGLTKVLINDLIKLTSYYLPYEFLELEAMLNSAVTLNCNDEFNIGRINLKFQNAGHIPGSVQISLKLNNTKNLVYTGDLNTTETKLLKNADTDYGEVSTLIIEATYANEDHPDREQSEIAFIDKASEIVEGGGTVLVPAFSVGRSQEVICILQAHNFKHPVTVDGMALQVNEIMLDYPSNFRDYTLLKRALENVKLVHRWKDRRDVVNRPGVIVAPAGMLQGGTAAFYTEKIAKGQKNAILLVSYQIAGTPGRKLLEERKIYVEGKERKVEANVQKFDFSSHAGKTELENILKHIKDSPTVYVIHGSSENCINLAEWIKNEIGLTAIVPSAGEVYKI